MSILNKNLDTHFFLELKSPNKVKIFDYHLTKPLIAYVNVNNVLAIWDWERKTCLKCFSAAAIESKDLSKTVTVKSIKFLDKDILNALFPGEPFDSEAPFYAGTWLIVVAESKIYFYDYVSEKSETISLAQLDGKQPRCVEPVDMKHLAVGCTDGYVKNFDLGAWSTVKTLKGFHHKTVYNMMGYKQGDNSKNRLVVSGSDGTLACWNVEAEEILFKFGMLKSGKQLNTANSQEELTGIDYNRASNHIVTVTQSYVTVWSSLTGEELMRYKGIKDSYKNHLVEAVYLPYGSLSKDLMIGHSKSSEILMFDVNKAIKGKEKEPFLDCTTLVDFKNFEGYDKSLRIYNLKVHYEKPHLIFATTSQGTFILSLLKTSPPLNIIASPFYSAYITPKEVKELLTEDGTVKKLTSDHIQKCQTYELLDLENKSSNITVLSVNSDSINCHLLDRNKLHLLPEGAQATIKSVIGQVEAAAIDEEFELRSNLDGRYFSIRYQKSGLFSIYAITNKNLSLPRESDNLIQLESLHPAGKVERIHTGCAVSLEWHQDRDEFAALVPLDKSGKPIEVKEKVETVSKGGFFGGKHSKKAYFVDTNLISKTMLYLFQVYHEGSGVKVGVKQKTDKYVEPKKLFGGPFYGIVDKMTEPDFNELITPEIEPLKRDLRNAMGIKLTFFNTDESSGEIEKVGRPMLAAEHVYWNLAGNILIAAYRTSFFVFKYHPHELSFKLFASTNRKIHEGYFWENIFFYTTDTAIRMAVFDLPEGLLDMVIAEDNQGNNLVSDLFLDEYFTKDHDFVYDTIYPHPQIKPPGNLKFIGVYDYKLILAGSREEFFKIELDHPFLKICLNLQFNNGKECLEEVKKIDTKSWETIFDLFEAYNCHQEADSLLGLMTEREIELKSRCVLKRSFYRDNKECLTWLENSEDLSQKLKESLGLEFFKHYNSFPNFDMEGMPEAFRSDVMTVLCAEKTTAQLVDRNPGLDLVLKKDREIEEMNLKGYFEKLLALDK